MEILLQDGRSRQSQQINGTGSAEIETEEEDRQFTAHDSLTLDDSFRMVYHLLDEGNPHCGVTKTSVWLILAQPGDMVRVCFGQLHVLALNAGPGFTSHAGHTSGVVVKKTLRRRVKRIYKLRFYLVRASSLSSRYHIRSSTDTEETSLLWLKEYQWC